MPTNLFLIHLKELKYRVSYLILSIISCMIYCGCNWEIILYSFIKVLNSDKYIKKFLILDNFIYTGIMDVFINIFILCFLISVVINYTYMMFHILSFFVTGLYSYEFKSYLFLSIFSLTLVYSFLYVCYTLLLPGMYAFFLNLNELNNNDLFSFNFEIHINDIIILIYKITIFGFLLSQLPILIYLCYFLNLCDINILLKLKNIIIFFLFILISMILPLDLVNAIITYLILIILYEISIFFILYLETSKNDIMHLK